MELILRPNFNVKARKDGANYLRSLLLGYEDAPEGLDVEGYYNKYMRKNNSNATASLR